MGDDTETKEQRANRLRVPRMAEALEHRLKGPSAHDQKIQVFDAMLRAFMPVVFRGRNGRRACWNLWHGASRWRTWCRPDGGPIMRALASWADRVGAVSRTLCSRTALGMVM